MSETQNAVPDAFLPANFTVIEKRVLLGSKNVVLILAPLGTPTFDDTALQVVLSTSDEELIAALPLGAKLDFSENGSVDLQASAFGDALKHFGSHLAQAFGVTVTPDEKNAAEQAVIAFVGKTGLNLALDAVSYVNAKLPGTGGVAARDAAVAKFKADAAEAKLELSHFASAALNFIIEGALQIALNKGMVVLATAVAAAV